MSIMRKKVILALALVVFLGGISLSGTGDFVTPASAQIIVPTADVDTGGSGNVETSVENAFNAVSSVLLIIALGVLLITLIVGAIRYMTAGGDSEKAGQARSIIINGLIGAVILFALGWLIGVVFDFTQDVFS